MSDDRRQLDDEALDALLAHARWPEPAAESIQRLERCWDEVWRPAWYRRITPWAVAAAVLLAAATAVSLHLRPAPTIQRAVLPPTPLPPPATPDRIGRPPTLMELAVVLHETSRARPAPIPLPEARAIVERTIAHRASAPTANVSNEADALRHLGRADWVEQRLVEATRHADLDRRIAALELLDALDSSRAMSVAMVLYDDSKSRSAAATVIQRRASVSLLADLAQREADPDLQQRWLSTLLCRATPEAINVYLHLTLDSRTAAATLAAAREGAPPAAVDALLAQLGNQRLGIRIAAARILGQIDGPQTTARLEQMIESNINRREAIFALLCSRGSDAADYLADAESRRRLGAIVRSVQNQFKALP